MMAWGVAAAIVDATRKLWPATMLTQVGFMIAALVNVMVFVITGLFWYWKASRRAYVVGMVVWLAVYLFWSVIYAPPTGCVSI